MNRLPKPKEPNYGFIEFTLKFPSQEITSPEKLKQYIKKNLRISLANKFNSPEDLERYVKGKNG